MKQVSGNIKCVDEKLVKEIENFIWASLRIIAQETVFQKDLRTVLPVRSQSTVTYIFEKLYIEVTY